MRRRWLPLSLVPVLLGACVPTVRVVTPEPVKIDVNMNVNIKSPPMPGTSDTGTVTNLAARRRLRMGEIQDLKNGHVIGENRDGYLEIVEHPTDVGYNTYAANLVKDENTDRTQLYLDNAQQQGKPLEIIEHDYAHQWAERAYPGEYIQDADGQWKKK
jgi:uncharacterized protein YdbL (DUF1318 family)